MHFGIDVGGTKTEFAVFDRQFVRVLSRTVTTPTDNYREYLDTLCSLVEHGDCDFPGANSLGVGITGIVDRDGCSMSVNVPCTNGRNVERDLSERMGRTVRCINDVRAFAISEARGGAAADYRTMVGVILGTGAASGYCRDGNPVLGIDGVAGEWGHLPVDARLVNRYGLPLFECPCGQIGCQERYVSGPGMSLLAEYFSGERMDSSTCVERYLQGDEATSKAFGVWLQCVAAAVTQLVLNFNPEVVVIGGGMSRIPELFEKLPGLVATQLLKGVPSPPILRARFGDDSGVRGAAIVGALS